MVVITLDEVVRKTLAKSRLPMHYYVKYLLFASDALKDMQYNMLPNFKTVELTLDSNFEATLPSDCVEVLGAYRPIGDKMIELGRNQSISTLDNSGTGFGAGVSNVYSNDMSLAGYAARPLTYFDIYGEAVGKLFGNVNISSNQYRILPDLNKIRFDNNTDLTKVNLRYITLPVKVSNKSVIHPFVESAIEKFIMWQRAYYWKENDVMMKRAEFFNQRRITKAMFNPVSITDVKHVFRAYISQSVKT